MKIPTPKIIIKNKLFFTGKIRGWATFPHPLSLILVFVFVTTIVSDVVGVCIFSSLSDASDVVSDSTMASCEWTVPWVKAAIAAEHRIMLFYKAKVLL